MLRHDFLSILLQFWRRSSLLPCNSQIVLAKRTFDGISATIFRILSEKLFFTIKSFKQVNILYKILKIIINKMYALKCLNSVLLHTLYLMNIPNTLKTFHNPGSAEQRKNSMVLMICNNNLARCVKDMTRKMFLMESLLT